MNIFCVANDIPLPANSGGRVDVWRRLCAFKAAGHNIVLVCWVDVGRVAPPSNEVLQQLQAVCDEVIWLPITRSLSEITRRSLWLWRWPSHVAARKVTSNFAFLENRARAFKPDIIWLDGLYGGAVAHALSQRFKCPLWYRSHNIEHRYMAAQRSRERRLVRRLGLWANCLGLERFERFIFTQTAQIFDISLSDADFWRQQGFGAKTHWLPTLVDNQFAARLKNNTENPSWDLVYFGNLTTPNNIEAIEWLIQRVLPLVPQANLRIVVAGSNPADAVIELIKSDLRVQLVPNPEDMTAIIGAAHVLVNPMQAGSGVNLKSVEMLFTDAALVSTSVGAAGLPTAVQACFHIANTPEEFASAIVRALGEPVELSARESVRNLFSFSAVEHIFQH